MTIDLKKLAKFLVKAKTGTYASMDKKKIVPERTLHNELDFSEGDFYYRDSYVGFFQAPGMEEVRLSSKYGRTIWTMAYSGGMNKKFHGDIGFAKETFSFLKNALGKVNENAPFRGPAKLKEGNWEYINTFKGDIENFVGHEKILFKGKEVFSQDYMGGLVVEKE